MAELMAVEEVESMVGCQTAMRGAVAAMVEPGTVVVMETVVMKASVVARARAAAARGGAMGRVEVETVATAAVAAKDTALPLQSRSQYFERHSCLQRSPAALGTPHSTPTR